MSEQKTGGTAGAGASGPNRQSALSSTREPVVPPRHVLDLVSGRVLDPGTALAVKGIEPRSTTYVGPRLILARTSRTAEVLAQLQEVARGLGWEARVHPDDVHHVEEHTDPEQEKAQRPSEPEIPGVVRVDITVAGDQATMAPDGWVLLQNARVKFGREAMARVGLDHVVLVRDIGAEPFHGTPFHGTPFHGTSDGVSSYGIAGSGGRQPMMYAGPVPHRHRDAEITGRRPVVATLDTGCGTHDWLTSAVRTGPRIDGRPIGYVDEATDPERWFDQVGALDGGIDPLAGHGTFIAGLIHQSCPDADIVAWRIVGSDGPIVESDLIQALRDICELVRRHRHGQADGLAIDVLNLSLGYYHETPQDELVDPTLSTILRRFGEYGVTVVCSAGNDATARPMYPAAFGPWETDRVPTTHRDRLPVVSVGALNPNRTDALFSNAGPWVRAYAPGAAVMSTLPPFQGGLEPHSRTTAWQRERESIDPDDYTGSFALWSGTSFAAPVIAGRIAARLLGTFGKDDGCEAAVTRGWTALTAVTDLTP